MTSFRPDDELDDRQIVQAIRAGDPSAFEQLVRRKTGKVYGVCYRVTGNAEDARDVSQLVFIRLWEHLDKYDSAFGFDTWLYRLVTNVAIDFLRGRQTREAAVSSNLRLVKTVTDPDQAVAMQRKEVETLFNDLSTVLSPKQKMIFVMKEMEDLSSAEISRILGCRESTVRNHLFSARKIMQKQLKAKYPEYARLWRKNNELQ